MVYHINETCTDFEVYKLTERDGVVAKLGEQGLHLGLPALPQTRERVALEGVEVGLSGAGHDERADAMRVTYVVKFVITINECMVCSCHTTYTNVIKIACKSDPKTKKS